MVLMWFCGQAGRQSDNEGSGQTSCSASNTRFSMQIFLQWLKLVALELKGDDHVESLRQAVQVTLGLCRLSCSSRCTRLTCSYAFAGQDKRPS